MAELKSAIRLTKDLYANKYARKYLEQINIIVGAIGALWQFEKEIVKRVFVYPQNLTPEPHSRTSLQNLTKNTLL